LVLNVASSAILLGRTNWSEVLGTEADGAKSSLFWVGGIALLGLLFLLFSWLIPVAVIVYSRSLAKRGVLT
jgi:hypothetical protein